MKEKHVFVDWYEVDPGYGIDAPGYMPFDGSPYGVEIVAHKPFIEREPLLSPSEPWDIRRCGFGSMFFANGKYYFFYEAINRTPNWIMLCLATSEDGEHWIKPKLGLVEFQGSKENNIIKMGAGEGYGYIDEGDLVYYDTEDVPEDEKFKMLFTRVQYEGDKVKDVGIYAGFSKDGLHWNYIGRVFGGGDSFIGIVFDNGKYYAFLKSQDPKHLVRRTIVRYESVDFRHWENPTFIFNGSMNDKPDMDHYTSPVFRWPGVSNAFVMMPTVFFRTQDFTNPIIAFSRDLNTWTVPLKNGTMITSEDMGGNKSIYANAGYIIKDNKAIHTFSSAFTGHNGYTCDPLYQTEKGTHSTYRMIFREDGYTSLHADSHGGFTTIPFFVGEGIELNAQIGLKGFIKIALTDIEKNEPYEGFSFEDCHLEKIDDIHYKVTFAKGYDELPKDKKVRLKVKLFRSDIYSYSFVNIDNEDGEKKMSYRII